MKCSKKGLFLFHKAKKTLHPTDKINFQDICIIIMDALWEIAVSKLGRLQKLKNNNYQFRKIPKCFSQTNPFYRKKDPIYFSKTNYFSTAESLAAALFVFGEHKKAFEVLEILQYGCLFYKLNEKCIRDYKQIWNGLK